MRRLVALLAFSLAVFGQSDRGTITGTISDPANAVIPNASVTARNSESGAQYKTVTTPTGNYTLSQLPAGPYDLSIEAAGFNKFTQQGIRVQVAQAARIDIALQVGGATESITVNADAPLLKTDSGEQSHNISTLRMNALPLNFGASGTVRNPYTFVTLLPGASMTGSSSIRINGTPTDTSGIRVEGQEATNTLQPGRPDEQEPSVEALQEISVQTSNFAAEYGQVGGGLFNLTAKSGTNQFHGSGYEYFVNEALNAGIPFTNNGRGGLSRPVNRKHDFGFSVGGPVRIPHVYNGRNRTFFFFNYESYRTRTFSSGTFITVPTAAMRNGDFSAILTGRALGTDPLGRTIAENTIYDPASGRTVNGVVVRDPFVGNIIPKSRFDPVAAKIQALLPAPTKSGLVNNFEQVYPGQTTKSIPSVKIDHSFNDKSRMSFYYTHYHSASGIADAKVGSDGLPPPLTAANTNIMSTPTFRLSYDYSVTPTLLVHAGAGFLRQLANQLALASVVNYDAVGQLGFKGSATDPAGFPRITGLSSSYGGLSISMGPANVNHYYLEKPTAVLSVTLVHDKHTYKIGADFRIDGFTDRNVRGSQGVLNLSATESGLPSTDGQNLGGGSVGFPYASFLLGSVNNASVSSPQLRKSAWALFIQDSWKITRRLTLDYGLRWDLQGALREIHYRTSEFGPNTPNPSAGGLLGAVVYEGFGPGRCNCNFTQVYPYAIGPRLGLAYQFSPKTVIRAGWGLSYGSTPQYNFITNTPIVGVGYNQLVFFPTSFGDPAVTLQGGLPYTHADMYPTTLDPGIRPSPGQINSPPYLLDHNGGRPLRVNQWSIGLQREITKNLVIEAAYVGNRSVWDQANSMVDLNALTPQRLKSFGLDIGTAADRTLLSSRLSSAAQARGFKLPYAGYPTSLTVAQSLRPYPQYGTIPVLWAPLGNTWYDSLQAKATKRYSHGLDLTSTFTWQKELVLGSDTQGGSNATVNDVFNRPNQKTISPSSLPFVFSSGFNYQAPAWGRNRALKMMLRDWTVGGILRYQSGLPILVPAAQNTLASVLFRGTFANRVPGQPLFLQDLNCHCFDPNTTFVLNPKAWSDPALGQWGTSAVYYNDYRYARRPSESLSLGRLFHIREGMSFQVRAEFFNVFNRTYLNNPDSTNALATQSRSAQGAVVSGFGRINTGTTFSPPRAGQLIARFQW
jgi:hypothetical protein